MKLRRAESLAKELVHLHLGNSWSFHWSNRKRAFGDCSVRCKEIRLSKYLTEVRPLGDVLATILHEIAHVLAYNETGVLDHGTAWCREARRLGVKQARATSTLRDESGETPILESPWVLVIDRPGEPVEWVRGWYRRPSEHKMLTMHRRHLPRDKERTQGYLRVMTWKQYQELVSIKGGKRYTRP